jgi:hypothetical protein
MVSPISDAGAFVTPARDEHGAQNYMESTIRCLAMGRMLNHEADKQKPRRSGVFASTAESPD